MNDRQAEMICCTRQKKDTVSAGKPKPYVERHKRLKCELTLFSLKKSIL